MPYCLNSRSTSKQFIKTIDKFAKDMFEVRITWLTKKLKTLFRVKDKSLHYACKIYKGVCSCGESSIGETIRNDEVRWDEYNNPMKNSNPSNHIKDNLDKVFNWSVLANAPKNMFQQKILEAYYIVLEKS